MTLEKIHVRVHPLDKGGNGRAWDASHWIEKVSCADAADILREVIKVRIDGVFATVQHCV